MYRVWDVYFRDEVVIDDGAGASNAGVTEREEELGADKVAEEEERDVTEREPQYEGGSPNSWEGLTGVVSSANVMNGVLRVRVNIDQYLESGTCELILMNGGTAVYNEMAEIVGGASNGECRGFDVKVDGLPSGMMQIMVRLSAEGKSGEITGEVEI